MSSRNPLHRADSLAELLAWHDEDFVRCAFVTILGRQPDPHGEAYYVEQVRQGQSRLRILYQLRNSAEGRAFDPGIAGLDRALRRAKWQRAPIVGHVLRMFNSNADDNGRRAREQRARINAATLERYTLYTISLKLGGIEWLLKQQSDAREADKVANPVDRQSLTSVVAATLTATKLKHMAPKSPLAKFFADLK